MLENLPDLLNATDKPFLFKKKSGQYQAQSYAKIADKAERTAVALIEYGIKPGDKVAIFSNNRPEWIIADLAILMIGAVVVPIYPTLGKEEVTHILNDSESKAIIAETRIMASLAKECSKHCPKLTQIFQITRTTEHRQFKRLYSLKRKEKESAKTALNRYRAALNRESLATIVYTSGTTGPAKGVMLTHGNILANIEGVLSCLPLDQSLRTLSFLPLSHAFERTVGYYIVLAVGGEIYFAESMNTVSTDLPLAKPTVLVSVPRLYEKVYARIYSQAKGLKAALLHWTLQSGKQRFLNNGKAKHPLHWLSLQLTEILVRRPIQKKFGGQLQFFVSGGAPLSEEIHLFFEAMGLPIIAGYGLSETAPIISCNRLDNREIGSVGPPLPNVSIKIANDAELWVKGPNVMQGYYKNKSATENSFSKDGWLKTGDIVKKNPSGSLSIIDRKKELIVLSNGKNVAPLPLEEAITSSALIDMAIIIGNSRPFISALLLINKDASEKLPKNSDLKQMIDHEIKEKTKGIFPLSMC